MSRPIAIFRTKDEILVARDVNDVQIADNVINNPVFISAKMQDTLGFKVVGSSDVTVVDVAAVKDDIKTFLEFTFGEAGVKSNGTTETTKDR